MLLTNPSASVGWRYGRRASRGNQQDRLAAILPLLGAYGSSGQSAEEKSRGGLDRQESQRRSTLPQARSRCGRRPSHPDRHEIQLTVPVATQLTAVGGRRTFGGDLTRDTAQFGLSRMRL
jgi:hypothetical protein